MNDRATILTESSQHLATIIPFPNSTRSDSSDDCAPSIDVGNLLADPQFSTRIKEWIDASVARIYLREQFRKQVRHDDPFDAIYISDLKQDAIPDQTFLCLFQDSRIVDLSDTIVIRDGWDD